MDPEPSDGELIERLQSGDLDALGILYERHKAIVYRTALGITHEPATAEDILQDCFLRLHRYAHNVDSSRPLRPWLYRVTTNLAYNWARRRKKWHSSLHDVLDWLAIPINRLTEQQVEMNDLQDEVIDVLSSLSINQRIVITLFYLNSLKVEEIATILDCPAGTVKSRLYYGRENLRQRLKIKRVPSLEAVYTPV